MQTFCATIFPGSINCICGYSFFNNDFKNDKWVLESVIVSIHCWDKIGCRVSFRIFKINGSNLVELVESGKFITDKKHCKKIIKETLQPILSQQSIDTVTLSSTHLPFLKSLLEKEFLHIQFIDPGNIVAQKVYTKIKHKQSKRNSLKIFTSGDVKRFQKKLNKIGIKNKVSFLSIWL